MEYHNRLKNARIDKDLSQREVAEKIGTTQQQIYKYENGLQKMTIERLKQFCELYEISADYILGMKEGLSWPRTNSAKYNFLYQRILAFATLSQDPLAVFRS